MGGLFSSPKLPVREVDPELERLKAEEEARLKKLKGAAAERKKRIAAGMVGPKSLMTAGYKGYEREPLGQEVTIT